MLPSADGPLLEAGADLLEVPPDYSLGFRHQPQELERLRRVISLSRFLGGVMEALPFLVAVLTSSRQLLLANQAMRVFLGLSEGDLRQGPRLGEALRCIHAADSPHGCGTTPYCTQCGAFQTMMLAITQGRPARGECRLTFCRQGRQERLELALWCSPFEVEGHRFSLLTGVDIGDQKRRQALERIFFHDVLNTASTIISYTRLLEYARPDEIPELVRGLRNIAEDLVEEIQAQRDLLRAENDDLVPDLKAVDSERFLQRLRERFQHLAHSRQVRLVLDPQRDHTSLTSDPALLGRVLGNMVKNALEASAAGEQVTLGCRDQEDKVEFRVHNPAVMPEEVRLQVFQRSFSTKGRGRGLGTYSMRLLGERYLQGEVDFRSEPPHGTTFWIRLPRVPSLMGRPRRGQ